MTLEMVDLLLFQSKGIIMRAHFEAGDLWRRLNIRRPGATPASTHANPSTVSSPGRRGHSCSRNRTRSPPRSVSACAGQQRSRTALQHHLLRFYSSCPAGCCQCSLHVQAETTSVDNLFPESSILVGIDLRGYNPSRTLLTGVKD